MSSYDGRSMRQSKRYSVTALYLSMSAKDKDLEIEDDLAKGAPTGGTSTIRHMLTSDSAESPSRIEAQDFDPVKEELRSGEGCAIPRFADCVVNPESYGHGRSESWDMRFDNSS